jgi:hypothetical protein
MSSSRGDARADKRARTGGAKTAPGRGQRTSKFVVASYGYFLGILFETQEDLDTIETLDRIELLSHKGIGPAAEPLKPACSSYL